MICYDVPPLPLFRISSESAAAESSVPQEPPRAQSAEDHPAAGDSQDPSPVPVLPIKTETELNLD